MPRWLEILVCSIVFAIPSAIGLLSVWPIVMRRAVPNDMNGDAVGILAISLLLGALLTMLANDPDRTRARR